MDTLKIENVIEYAESKGIELSISFIYKSDIAIISLIRIPNELRGNGEARKILDMTIKAANDSNITLALTPSNSFGSNKERLFNFYKKLGFINNTGKNKNFMTRELLIKYPKQLNESILKVSTDINFNSWKRKNVTLRGMKDRYLENKGGTKYGQGLYTAPLSNIALAKQYGKVYFLLNAKPNNPKIFNNTNDAEIFIWKIKEDFCKKNNPNFNVKDMDIRFFDEKTNINEEMINLGYDGLIVKGREMVNYLPDDNKIKYFESLNQLKQYWEDFIKNDLKESVEIPKTFEEALKMSSKIFPENVNDKEQKKLNESEVSALLYFPSALFNRYGFIQRDSTKFISMKDKKKIIYKLENMRKNSGEGYGLPKIKVNPQMLIATQQSIETDKFPGVKKSKKNPFVIKLNGISYILDGHTRLSLAISENKKELLVNYFNLDNFEK